MKKTDSGLRSAANPNDYLLWGIITIVILVISIVFWFVLVLKNGLSTDISHWGNFGDFIGGVANPIIALLALLGLIRTIQLQQQEFQEMRDAMNQQEKQLLSQSQAMNDQIRQTEQISDFDDVNRVFTELINDLDELSQRRITYTRRDRKDVRSLLYYLDLYRSGAPHHICEYYESMGTQELFDDLYDLLKTGGEIYDVFVQKYPHETSVFIAYRIKKFRRWAKFCESTGRKLHAFSAYRDLHNA